MPKTPVEWAALVALVTAAVVIFGGVLWLVRRRVRPPGNPEEAKEKPEPQPERPLPPPPPRRRGRPFNLTYTQIGDGVYRVEGNPLWISYGEPGATNRLRLEPGAMFLIWSDTLFTSDQDIRLTDWRPINRAAQEGYIVQVADSEVTENIDEALRAPMRQMQEYMAQMGQEMSRMGQEMGRALRQDMQQLSRDMQQLSRDGQWSVTTTVVNGRPSTRVVNRTPANPKAKVKTEEKKAPSRYDRLSDDSDDL